jgi:hypothetical protein
MEIKSTNINKTNNYIFFKWLKKKTTTYVDGNPVPGLGLAQTCIGQYIEEWDQNPRHSRHDITEILLKVALNSINHLCLLDNWICNHNTDINKQKNVCLGKEKEQRLVDLESV